MKLYKKAMSVGLSLVLCLSMVSPAFAASFSDLQGVIDNKTSYSENGEEKIGYNEGTVTLYEDVKYDADEDVKNKTIDIRGDQTSEITLNLNGFKIDGTGSNKSVMEVRLDANVTINGGDENGEKGAITGGKATDQGGAIRVTSGATLNLNDTIIEGNTAKKGGGIYVTGTNTTANLDHVTVIDNKASKGDGGGINATNGATVTIKNSEIGQVEKGNSANNGGGIAVDKATVNVINSTVSGNTGVGGGIYSSTDGNNNVTLRDSTVSSNSSYTYGGGVSANGGTLTVTGGGIYGNTAKKGGDDITAGNRATINLPDAEGMKDAVATDNKPVTGWYNDAENARWKDGTYSENDDLSGKLFLKAAHNEYVEVTYRDKDGNEATMEMEKGRPVSEFTPTSIDSCYVFDGWESAKDVTVTGGLNLTAKWNEKHTPGNAVQENVESATCAKEGSYNEVVHCTECDAVISSTSKTINKLAHTSGTAVQENVESATCTKEGSYNEVVRCTECNAVISSTPKTIDKLAHTPGEAARENEVPAEPGKAGSYDEVIRCEVCGELISSEKQEIAALPMPVVPDSGSSDEPAGPAEVEIEDPNVPLAGLPITLDPADKLTRAQLAHILYWLDGELATVLADFLDVAADSDYADAIGWATANGIMHGVEDSLFAPDDFVTRSQLVAALNCYAAHVGSDVTVELDGDADEIMTWAAAEVIINDFFSRLKN